MSIASNKNPYRIITEATKDETCINDCLFDDEIEAEFDSVYDDFEDVDDPFYTEEVVPVFKHDDGTVVVETDNLGKFMESNEIADPLEAVERLAEYYDVPLDQMGVLFESYDYSREILDEAKAYKVKTGEMKRLNLIKSTTKLAKDLQAKGIKTFKKIGKKKPKNKKKK